MSEPTSCYQEMAAVPQQQHPSLQYQQQPGTPPQYVQQHHQQQHPQPWGHPQQQPPQYQHHPQHQVMMMPAQGQAMYQPPVAMGQPVMVARPQPQAPPGMLFIQYLPPGCLCCGQPTRRPAFDVKIDGMKLHHFSQGTSATFPVPPGMHQLTAEQGGIGGFFNSLGGGVTSAGPLVVSIQPGKQTNVTLRWDSCCMNKWPALVND